MATGSDLLSKRKLKVRFRRQDPWNSVSYNHYHTPAARTGYSRSRRRLQVSSFTPTPTQPLSSPDSARHMRRRASVPPRLQRRSLRRERLADTPLVLLRSCADTTSLLTRLRTAGASAHPPAVDGSAASFLHTRAVVTWLLARLCTAAASGAPTRRC